MNEYPTTTRDGLYDTHIPSRVTIHVSSIRYSYLIKAKPKIQIRLQRSSKTLNSILTTDKNTENLPVFLSGRVVSVFLQSNSDLLSSCEYSVN